MSGFEIPAKFGKITTGLFNILPRFAIRFPRFALLSICLLTFFACPGLWRLKLRTDAQVLVSSESPEVAFDRTIRNKFDVEDQMVVIIQANGPDGIFNSASLQLVRELTADLAKLPRVNPSNLISLATEPSFRLRPGTLINQRLLEPPLKTASELATLRNDLRRIEIYTGTLVSFDGDATAILLGVPANADRPALYQEVLKVIAARPKGENEIFVTGAPVAESLLGSHVLEDLGVPKTLLGAIVSDAGLDKPANAPGAGAEIRAFIARHFGLAPLAALIMLLVLLAAFRNLPAALMPLLGVAATLVFVLGVMGWCGVPIYLTLAVMPVLLTVIGVTNDIYLFNRYFTLLRERTGSGHVGLVAETFEKLARPVALTSLTGAVGFFSFAFSPIIPVRVFGIVTAIGVLYGLFYSLAGVPALLMLLKPAWFRSLHRNNLLARVSLEEYFARFTRAVVKKRVVIAWSAIILTALTFFGIRRMAIQDSWLDAFDSNSAFRRDARFVNENFHGMHLLYVSLNSPATISGNTGTGALRSNIFSLPAGLVESPAIIEGGSAVISIASKGSNFTWQSHVEMAGRAGDHVLATLAARAASPGFWDALPNAANLHYDIIVRSHFRPEIIRLLRELGDTIRSRKQYQVGAVLGPPDYLRATRFMVRPNDPNARQWQWMDDAAQIKVLWDYYGLALGSYRQRQLVDSNYWQSLTTVFLKDANFADTAALMRDIRNFEREKLAPQGIKLGFAGDVAVSQSLIQGIVRTQLESLAISLSGIFLVTALFGGSLRWGFYCLLPNVLAVLVKFAVMGWCDIPLGVATSMFAAMTLGLGVNCAIHILESFRQAHGNGATTDEAVLRALSLTGPPALLNTLCVCLGFGVLLLSQVPANARLGLLLIVGLANCFIASILLLPVLLNRWPLKK